VHDKPLKDGECDASETEAGKRIGDGIAEKGGDEILFGILGKAAGGGQGIILDLLMQFP